MPSPTRAEVSEAVVMTIAGFTGLSIDQVDEGLKLTDPPLSFDTNRLAFLAQSLRGYVRFHTNDTKTVLAPEVRKSGLTVQGLCELIFEKVSEGE